MSKKLTVIVTAFNEDYQEIQDTMASLRSTAGNQIDTIFVDDGSPMPVSLQQKVTRFIRNEDRAGVAGARHIAATFVDTPWMLIIDAHSRFEPGWVPKVLERIEGRERTIFCGQCVALSKSNMDMAQATGAYNGATIKFFGPDANDGGRTQILEGKWASDRPGEDDYELAGIMGASYVVPTDHFFHIGGLRLLRGWGGDEPFLSLKTWLSGGEIRMLKCLRVGHQFRPAGPYRTETWALWYNKLAIIHTCLSDPWKQKLLDAFPTDAPVGEARKRIVEDWNHIGVEQAFNQRIFTRTFEAYLKAFNIEFGL